MNLLFEALRRQLECRARDETIRSIKLAHFEGTQSHKSAKRARASALVRMDTIRGKQTRRRTDTLFLNWRPSSEADAMALRCAWDYSYPRFFSALGGHLVFCAASVTKNWRRTGPARKVDSSVRQSNSWQR
jgi:hypothetical protein